MVFIQNGISHYLNATCLRACLIDHKLWFYDSLQHSFSVSFNTLKLCGKLFQTHAQCLTQEFHIINTSKLCITMDMRLLSNPIWQRKKSKVFLTLMLLPFVEPQWHVLCQETPGIWLNSSSLTKIFNKHTNAIPVFTK